MQRDRVTRRRIWLIGIDKNTDSALLNCWHWTDWIRLRILTTGDRREGTVGCPLARCGLGGNLIHLVFVPHTHTKSNHWMKRKKENTPKLFIVFTGVGSYKPTDILNRKNLKIKLNKFLNTTNDKTKKLAKKKKSGINTLEDKIHKVLCQHCSYTRLQSRVEMTWRRRHHWKRRFPFFSEMIWQQPRSLEIRRVKTLYI